MRDEKRDRNEKRAMRREKRDAKRDGGREKAKCSFLQTFFFELVTSVRFVL